MNIQAFKPHWNKKIHFKPMGERWAVKEIANSQPKPAFLLSKASPLSAVDSATFAKLAVQNNLSLHLPEFCASSNLLCFPDFSLSLEKHENDSNFVVYSDRDFTNYGTDRLGGTDSFKNTRVTRISRSTRFAGAAKTRWATSGFGVFSKYADDVNVPNLRFTSYSDDSNGHAHTFSKLGGHDVQKRKRENGVSVKRTVLDQGNFEKLCFKRSCAWHVILFSSLLTD